MYTALKNCLPLYFSMPALFHCFLSCPPWVSEVQFSSFVKGGAFSNRERFFFHLWNFENRPLKPGNFLSWYSKTSAAPKFNYCSLYWFADTFKLINYRQFCYRSSWGFWLFFFLSVTVILTELWSVKRHFFSDNKDQRTLFVIIWGNFGCDNIKIKQFLVSVWIFVTWSGTGNKIIVNVHLLHSF